MLSWADGHSDDTVCAQMTEWGCVLTALVTVNTDYLAQRDGQCIVPVDTVREGNMRISTVCKCVKWGFRSSCCISNHCCVIKCTFFIIIYTYVWICSGCVWATSSPGHSLPVFHWWAGWVSTLGWGYPQPGGGTSSHATPPCPSSAVGEGGRRGKDVTWNWAQP